jgi:phosphoribosyl-ATP pyrophosphohydrolase
MENTMNQNNHFSISFIDVSLYKYYEESQEANLEVPEKTEATYYNNVILQHSATLLYHLIYTMHTDSLQCSSP